jgi:type II secretory pathway pseudopilin PulG
MRRLVNNNRRLTLPSDQRGAALLMLLVILLFGAAYTVMGGLSTTTLKIERQSKTTEALALAKEALIGFAATYRDTHRDFGGNQDKPLGYLPCPDMNNDGEAEASCGEKDVSVIGRLPWKTLGLAPLRDDAAECLWYAVSGRAKNNPNTDVLNWDTLGQFKIEDASGTTLAGATAHEQPVAVIFAAHTPLGSQTRTTGGTTECAGSSTDAVADYLEGVGILGSATPPPANADSTIALASPDSIQNSTNNDRGLWISNKEIFDRIKGRSDFANDIGKLLDLLRNELNEISVSNLPGRLDTVLNASGCPIDDGPSNQKDAHVRCNWRNNLKYFSGTPPVAINGETPCNAVLFFSGERTSTQSRATPNQIVEHTNYLEGNSTTIFSIGGSHTISSDFDSKLSSRDLVRCIKGLPAGSVQQSFANNLSSFSKVGSGGGAAVSTDIVNKTVTITGESGIGNGCLWNSTRIPLAGRTLRAYYDFQFSRADSYALPTHTGSDRGNGFTFQMVKGDVVDTSLHPLPPNTCGPTTNMGALTGSLFYPDDFWGTISFIVETDVHKDSGSHDSTENHTAIMLNGNTDHGLASTITTACDGSAVGCRHSPANKFEEGDATNAPLGHSQRIEIHTGCNSSCSSCNSSNHVAPSNYAKINAWVDCAACSDLTTDFVSKEMIIAAADRDFSASGHWTGNNWAVVAEAFAHTPAAKAATLPNSALNSPPVADSTYVLSAKVSTSSAGTLKFSFGGRANGPISLNPGVTTFQFQLVASSSTKLTITPDASWAGSIDDISIVSRNTPSVQRCVKLDSSMNSVFFGFTGGFRSIPNEIQGVTLKNFFLHSD